MLLVIKMKNYKCGGKNVGVYNLNFKKKYQLRMRPKGMRFKYEHEQLFLRGS